MALMKWFAFPLGIAIALPAPAQATAPEPEQVLAIAAQVRRDGCKGHPGTPAPLRWSPALARAAALVAKGGVALQAIEIQGYRPTRIFQSNLSGYADTADAVQAFAQRYCADLVEPKFQDLGMHHDGKHWTILMAAPFELPQLADKRAASQRVLALVNHARAHPRQCGNRQFGAAPPLEWNDKLEQAAARHAADMAEHQYLEHKGRDGSTPSQRITRVGYRWRGIGENVAAGQPTPEEVVDDWLSSPGHCANIMEPTFAEMGVAFSVNMKTAAAVYWAQEFGRPH